MKIQKIGFIINPVAGGKQKSYLKDRIYEEFRTKDFIVKIRFTEYPGHASELTSQWVGEGYETIVAVGGDGTINEVARVLIDKETTLGVIPFGSGNGFARHFGFPRNFKKALRVLKQRKIEKIDVGFADEHPFFCTSGLGFDAETGYQFSHFGKRGFLSYVFSFFRVFRSYSSARYIIQLDEKIIEREAFFINIANISQFGYNFKIAPQASAADGKLDLVIVKNFPKIRGIQIALESFLGQIQKNPYVEYHKATKIVIKILDENQHIHLDGEPNPAKEITSFTLKPVCLKVIVP